MNLFCCYASQLTFTSSSFSANSLYASSNSLWNAQTDRRRDSDYEIHNTPLHCPQSVLFADKNNVKCSLTP